jgi:hypothetical protein
MNTLTPASRLAFLVCPLCEKGRLGPSNQDSMSCDSCSGFLSGAMVQTLRQIAVLPDALGNHPCECGHPQMRHLPDGVFHCPVCGSEVVPLNATEEQRLKGRSEAYWSGWVDGRFGEIGSFADNPSLAKLEDPSDRLEYYRGHRAGSQARQAASGDPSKAHQGFPG